MTSWQEEMLEILKNKKVVVIQASNGIGKNYLMRKWIQQSITNIQFDGMDMKDSPDFSDAYICYAEINGVALTLPELDTLNSDREFVHEALTRYMR